MNQGVLPPKALAFGRNSPQETIADGCCESSLPSKNLTEITAEQASRKNKKVQNTSIEAFV
jgi:hypothetical protein